jgi:hypothetical protein
MRDPLAILAESMRDPLAILADVVRIGWGTSPRRHTHGKHWVSQQTLQGVAILRERAVTEFFWYPSDSNQTISDTDIPVLLCLSWEETTLITRRWWI